MSTFPTAAAQGPGISKITRGYSAISLAESVARMSSFPEFQSAFKIITQTDQFKQMAQQVKNGLDMSEDSATAMALFMSAFTAYNFDFAEVLNKELLHINESPRIKELATFVLNLVDGMQKARESMNPGGYMFIINFAELPQLRDHLKPAVLLITRRSSSHRRTTGCTKSFPAQTRLCAASRAVSTGRT